MNSMTHTGEWSYEYDYDNQSVTKTTTFCEKLHHSDMEHSNQEPRVNRVLNKYPQPSHMPLYSMQNNDKETFHQHQQDWTTKFNELSLDSNKSPINILSEMMLKNRQEVTYKCISASGHQHIPIFRFMAKSHEIVAYGEGSTKKEAKANSAIAFLNKLDYSDDNKTKTEDTVIELNLELNHVGALQELCYAHCWESPRYEFSDNEPYKKVDHVWYSVCYVKEYKSTGEGKTKKAAKNQSARLMYDQIKILPELKNINKVEDYKYGMSSQVVSMERFKSSSLNDLEIFLNQLKLSTKPCLRSLKNADSINEIKTNATDLLNAIGKEENLNIIFEWITNKSSNVGMMVHLSILPLCLFVGTGMSIIEAQETAAYSALLYIKHFLE